MAVIPRVLFLIVVLELVEWLKVLQTQRAKKALLHFPCPFKGRWVAGGHGSRWLGSSRTARWHNPAKIHMSWGVHPTPFYLHSIWEYTWTIKRRTNHNYAEHFPQIVWELHILPSTHNTNFNMLHGWCKSFLVWNCNKSIIGTISFRTFWNKSMLQLFMYTHRFS